MDDTVIPETVTLPPESVAVVVPARTRADILAELADLNPYTVLNRMRNRAAELTEMLAALPPDSP